MYFISTSEIRSFRTCHRKFQNTYVHRRVPAGFEEPLTFGSAIHEGCDSYWSGESLEHAQEAIRAYLSKFVGSRVAIMQMKAKALISGYYGFWGDERDKWTIEGVEKFVQLQLSEGLTFIGRLDKLLRNKDTGRLTILDHKTTSQDVSDPACDYIIGLGNNIQITGYQKAVQESYTEEVDVIFDVIWKEGTRGPKGSKLRQKKDETKEEFKARQAGSGETDEEYVERLIELYKNPDRYQQVKIHRLKEQQDTWVEEVISTHDTIKFKAENGIYSQNDNACRMYGRLCPYFNVCTQMDRLESENFIDKPSRYPELEPANNEAELPF